MKHSITRILNFGAGIYNVWTRRNLRGIYNQLIELADLKGNERVLDVGCGPGNLDLMIAELLCKGSVHGIDIGPKMIETAKKGVEEEGHNVDYVVGDSTKLPYKTNGFDVVFSCLMYHHLVYEEKAQALKEIHRVLKPNGRYVSFEFQEFPTGILHGAFLRLFAGDSGVLHGLYPTELIEQSGFCASRESNGPSFWKDHHTAYRVLEKI
jgi:ubiquinone/menaquinone biosynthesis C-methylase UbiE